MSRSHAYAAYLVWTGAAQGPTLGYDGYSRAWRAEIAGKSALEGSADPYFRGDPALYNPEELLLVALSSCHMLTYLAWAARKGVAVTAYGDEASGTMLFEKGAAQFTEVVLHPVVTVAQGTDLALAAALHADAHRDCFIARSVNFPVLHEAQITVAKA